MPLKDRFAPMRHPKYRIRIVDASDDDVVDTLSDLHQLTFGTASSPIRRTIRPLPIISSRRVIGSTNPRCPGPGRIPYIGEGRFADDSSRFPAMWNVAVAT